MMDKELEQLYRASWDVLCQAIPKESRMSKPLLAQVPLEYEQSKIRLLIIGKETHGWGGPGWWDDWDPAIPDRVAWLRNEYQTFKREKKWRSPFFQAARKLQKLLNPDSDPSGFMWLNLFICDQNMAPLTNDVAECLRQVSLLRNEIAILEPHAVVFFTGTGRNDKGAYDSTIIHKRYFPDAMFCRRGNFWSQIHASGLPLKSVRTYHPNYLWRNPDRRAALDGIADWIKQP